jgi:DNA-binding NtrC family response regulator
VRELENAIERALILADGPVLEARDFRFFGGQGVAPGAPLAVAGGADAVALRDDRPETLDQLERRAIEAALRRNSFHRERSASELGITRRTLLNKIKEYGIEVPAG